MLVIDQIHELAIDQMVGKIKKEIKESLIFQIRNVIVSRSYHQINNQYLRLEFDLTNYYEIYNENSI